MDENEVKTEESVVQASATEQVNKAPAQEAKGMSITAFVLGIVSICTLCIQWLPIICGILAVIFGAIGRKRGSKALGTTGMILGIVTLSIYLLLIILGGSMIALLGMAAVSGS